MAVKNARGKSGNADYVRDIQCLIKRRWGQAAMKKMLRNQKKKQNLFFFLLQTRLDWMGSGRRRRKEGRKESLEALEGLFQDKPSQTAAVLSCEVTRFRRKKAARWRSDASELTEG